MNELRKQYGAKGLVVIGVTDDAGDTTGKVNDYIAANNIEYIIARGGGSGFETTGIPAAWLISPLGEVLWQGFPSELNTSLITKHLEDVWARPFFKLPKELAKVSAQIQKNNFVKAIELLEKHLEKESAPAAEAARAALMTAKEYGSAALKKAEKHVSAANHVLASNILELVEKLYKGSEIGDQAKTRLAELMKDDAVKHEVEATKLYEHASVLVSQRKYKEAAPVLVQVVKSKKYSDTKVRARAEKLLAKVQAKL